MSITVAHMMVDAIKSRDVKRIDRAIQAYEALPDNPTGPLHNTMALDMGHCKLIKLKEQLNTP